MYSWPLSHRCNAQTQPVAHTYPQPIRRARRQTRTTYIHLHQRGPLTFSGYLFTCLSARPATRAALSNAPTDIRFVFVRSCIALRNRLAPELCDSTRAPNRPPSQPRQTRATGPTGPVLTACAMPTVFCMSRQIASNNAATNHSPATTQQRAIINQ